MKSVHYIFIMNTFNIIVMIAINLLFLMFVNTNDYEIYSKYLWFISYCGIFNLGIIASIQKKFRNTPLEKFNLSTLAYHILIIIFIVGTTTYIASNIIKLPWINIFFIALISSLYYYSAIYLQIFKKLIFYNLILVIEKIFFMFSIIFMLNFNNFGLILIQLDLFLKGIIIFIPILLTLRNSSNKKINRFTQKELLIGLNIMLGNWFLIYILKSDMFLLNKSTLLFGQYAMAISLTTMIILVVQPLKYILYNQDQTIVNLKHNNNKIYYTIFIFVILIYFLLKLILIRNIFPKYNLAMEIGKYIIFLMPLYIVVTTNLINVMQINEPKKYFFTLMTLSIILLVALTFINIDSYSQLIIFKMATIVTIYLSFSYISISFIDFKFLIVMIIALLSVYFYDLNLVILLLYLVYNILKNNRSYCD